MKKAVKKIGIMGLSLGLAVAVSSTAFADSLVIDNVSSDVSDTGTVYVVPGSGKIKTFNRFIDPFSKEAQELIGSKSRGECNDVDNCDVPISAYSSRLMPLTTQGLPLSYSGGGVASPTPTLFGSGLMPKSFSVKPGYGFTSMGSKVSATGATTLNLSTSASVSGGSGKPKVQQSISGGLIGSISTGMVASIQDGDTQTEYQKHTTARGIVKFGQAMSYQSSISNKQ